MSEINLSIKNFKEGTSVTGIYILNDITIRTSSNNTPYLSGNLADKTGKIAVVKWDYFENLTSSNNGCIVSVTGIISSYHEKLQFVANSIEIYPGPCSPEILSNLVEHAPIDVEERIKYLSSMQKNVSVKQKQQKMNGILLL